LVGVNVRNLVCWEEAAALETWKI